MSRRQQQPPGDPLWYKDGIIYQLHVKAFFDSNDDGIGDFRGLTQKLDYLQDLGVTSLWILPFYPSPLKDDGYDIANYSGVHPSYGDLADFKIFLKEAHARGLRVITELVVNHTSDQHAWFQKSRRARPGSRLRDFYVWSDNPEKYREARIIFKDFERSNWTWDPLANAYYWHRFYHHQPDLNFDNPAVHKALFQVLDSWMEMGVDGFRLDAIPYLYEREGTSCENLPETHAYLKKLRAHVDQNFPGKLLLAEANQWPEDSREYFGNGDECNMAFHFPLMPRLYMSVAMEDRYPIVDILQQTPEIPDSAQWAIFLRNHDELTLEMVTDEDRDYMYRMYASDPRARINLGIRRRLAPLMFNQRRKIELMNALLFSFPGTPIIYYGDEIGMGDNIYLGDRNGVRTPMQWSPDRNAGFSRANPQRLYMPVIIDPEYHYEAINVEAQQNNTQSLLWWMKRTMALRKQFKAFGRGKLQFLHPDNRKILAFFRSHEDETILVVANLSRFVQWTNLDLSAYRGLTPVELFGQTEFPTVTDQPYMISLGPHTFYWFAMRQTKPRVEVLTVDERLKSIPTLAGSTWEEITEGTSARAFDHALAAYLRSRRWFGSKTRTIKTVQIATTVPVAKTNVQLAIIRVEYVDATAEGYTIPLALASGEIAAAVERDHSDQIIARVAGEPNGLLYEGIAEKEFSRALLRLVSTRGRMRGETGELAATRVRGARVTSPEQFDPQVLKAEQSNTAIAFGDQYFLKLFRRIEEGMNVDLEVTRFLTERTDFTNLAPLVGAVEYRSDRGRQATIAMVQKFVPNLGDAWSYTLDELGRFFERMVERPLTPEQIDLAIPHRSIVDLMDSPLPAVAPATIGRYINDAELLGRRTAEMHLALASEREDPAFAPEPFNPFYQRSIYQSMRTQANQALHLLRKSAGRLPEAAKLPAEEVLSREKPLMEILQALLGAKIDGLRTRIHGDYHLGQVLYTGKDFVLIDFEGEPSRPLTERRIKRSPLRDVAGMLRSFHYAPYSVLLGYSPGVTVRSEDVASLETAARFWQLWVSVVFLRSYVEHARRGGFLPSRNAELRILLDAYVLEKATYELGYELNSRPDWIAIPLRGILQMMD